MHPNGVVGVTPSEHFPALRIQPRAEFLHGLGPEAAVEWFRRVVEAECGAVLLTISRLDLHADFQGWALDWQDRERFVCRADALAMRGSGGELTGWEFGKRSSGTICARIYDKTREILVKGGDYVVDMWGDAYEPNQRVLRVEFEFNREGLKEFGINTATEAIDGAGGLWVAATADWLTYRWPTGDETRSRWPIAPEWEQVQRARIGGAAHGLERMREGQRQGELRTIAPPLVGLLASFGAIVGTTGIPDTCREVAGLVRRYSLYSEVPFGERIAEKRRPK